MTLDAEIKFKNQTQLSDETDAAKLTEFKAKPISNKKNFFANGLKNRRH